MAKEFLRQVAEHYYSDGSIQNRCFIFPNRRSLAFFKKYLGAEVAASGSGPVSAPKMYTVNDFFAHLAGVGASSRIQLLLELYGCYSKLNPKSEPLDDFIFWGDVLLSDFDDIDKYLVDAKQLFRNVSDLKEIQDTFTYLSDEQRTAIEHFLAHFRNGGSLTVNINADNPNVKESFLQIWELLYQLYTDFNKSLAEKGMAYEGQIYRSLAERISATPAVDVMAESFPDVSSFVFVGLNTLNECEKKVMGKMRDAGIAEFCWDYSSKWIKDAKNKSSFFMDKNVTDFPQAFDMDTEGLQEPEINVLSVPSSIGQTKQLPAILKDFADKQHCGAISEIGIDTAVVLPDEGLLLPALNSIPEDIAKINVTMGYPMGSSEFYSLISDIAQLQQHLRVKDGEWMFYHKQVWSIFSNSLFKNAIGDDAKKRIAAVKKDAKYYISRTDLVGAGEDAVMNAIFTAVVSDVKMPDSAQVHRIEDYLRTLVSAVALAVKTNKDMAGELEFAKAFYIAVNCLSQNELPVLPATYFRILDQMLVSAAVPFKGEPLEGLQIMGPLETRALDFRNLIILSCNEGTFPRRSVSSSFIPPELRKAFALPTYEYQDAVWAYYFYRMIQRAENVWILFDSRTEGMKSGEESRYIKQLELHLGAKTKRYVAKATVGSTPDADTIVKTAADVETIRNARLSASALQNYLSCPLKFYFHTVKGLKQEDEVAESLDAGMIGNVLHGTMQALYFGEVAMDPDFPMDRQSIQARMGEMQKFVTREYIEGWIKRKDEIRARIRSLIKAEMNSFEVSGRNLVFEDVVLQSVLKILERDLEYMKAKGTMTFEIKGLELPCSWTFDGFNFTGYIDRLDSFQKDELRVVDYKTGKVTDEEIEIDDTTAEAVIAKLFGAENKDRPKIALQLFLYDMFVEEMAKKEGAQVFNSIYSNSRLFVSPVEVKPQSPVFTNLMKQKLSDLLAELTDLNVPFKRCADTKTCQYCDFKTICGR